MKDYQHYIITRFNLGLYSKKKIDPNEWMKERIELFEKYCLTSIINQSCKDFKWILLLDDRTSKKIINRISQLTKEIMTEIIIVPWGDNGRFGESNHELSWRKLFGHIAQNECKIAIMTRLDNDDALGKEFVKSIKSKEPFLTPGAIIDSRYGLILDINNKKIYATWHPKGSPFITYVEQSSWKMKTVYYTEHRAVAVRSRKFLWNWQIDFGWLIVLHNKNISNRTYFEKIQDKRILREATPNELYLHFGIRL